EATEIAPHQQVDALVEVELRLRTEPVLGGGEQVGAAPFPGAGRWHPDQVDPQADPTAKSRADQFVDLQLPDRAALGDGRAHLLGGGGQLRLTGVALGRPQKLPPAVRADRTREWPVVVAGDEVDGGA